MKKPPNSIGDYIFESSLGEGSFASVKKGHHKITNTPVAIKIIAKSSTDRKNLIRLHREIDILQDIDHPFVAHYFEKLEDSKNVYLIMEYAPNGDLLSLINKKRGFTENQARFYFCQFISILEYLHIEKKISHRDLKAENVLLDKNNNIRLIDFGLSNLFSNENPFLQTPCGSPAYAPPELFQGRQYTAKCDIWSLGILLFGMVAGYLPFNDQSIRNLSHKILYSDPQYPIFFSSDLVDLLQRLLSKDINSRPSFEEIKNHPWFSSIDFSYIMDLNFGYANDWRINPSVPPDPDIIQKLQLYKINTQNLAVQLSTNKFTQLTALYKMLKKQKITNEMKEFLKYTIPSISAQRSAPIHPPSFPATPRRPNRRKVSNSAQNSDDSPLPSPRPSPVIGSTPPSSRHLLKPKLVSPLQRRKRPNSLNLTTPPVLT